MEKCQCGFAKSIVGDGCRYCQPQTYIDKIHDQIAEERKEMADLVDRLKGYVVHKGACGQVYKTGPCTCGLTKLLEETNE